MLRVHSREPRSCAGIVGQRLFDARKHLGIELAVPVRTQQFIVELQAFAHSAALTRDYSSPGSFHSVQLMRCPVQNFP